MASILVSIRTSEGGGAFEFTPAEGEFIRWQVEDGALSISKRVFNSETKRYGDPSVFRVFASGVWFDVETVE